jgi:hypothetical protein
LTSETTVPHAVDQLVAWKTDVCWCIVPEKRDNISEAIASINQRTLRRVAQNMVKRVNACIQERFYVIVVLRSETSFAL